MKRILFALLLIGVSVQAQWEPDFGAAKAKAAEGHKLILLNFSGSDWCGPCIMFRREYLDSKAFQDFASGHLILVNADFPRKSKNKLPDEVVKRNEALAEQYNRQGNFPYTLLLDANGEVLKTWTGKPDKPLEEWLLELQQACKL